jgi:hypothetical protein
MLPASCTGSDEMLIVRGAFAAVEKKIGARPHAEADASTSSLGI